MKARKAREKIRTHLKRNGQGTDFHITESFCMYWWYQLNNAVFDSMLNPPIRFELKDFRKNEGWCLPWRPNCKVRRVTIGINTEIWERKYFLNVLAHEIVHQYQWEIDYDWDPIVNHNESFRAWGPKIKQRLGLDILEFV